MQRDWIAALKYICIITIATGILAVGAYAQTIQTWDFDSTCLSPMININSSYEHPIENWLPGRSVAEANFDLTYQMSQYKAGWAWFVCGNDRGNIDWWLLGKLNVNKTTNAIITDSFVVPQVALNYMGDNGKLVIKFREDPDGASGIGSMNLDKTRLYGNYTAIPEFGSLPLAMMGLAPIAFALKRRKQ